MNVHRSEFRKANGQRLRVKRQVTGGIEFEEPDPIERTVGFQLNGRSEVTRHRMRRIAQVKGWELGQFKLKNLGGSRQRHPARRRSRGPARG